MCGKLSFIRFQTYFHDIKDFFFYKFKFLLDIVAFESQLWIEIITWNSWEGIIEIKECPSLFLNLSVTGPWEIW